MRRLLAALLAGAALLAPAWAGAEPEGTMVFEYNTYAHITTNTTTTLAANGNLLSEVCVNTKGASSNIATIYDNSVASAPVIGVIDTTAGVGCYKYNVFLTSGFVTIVTATGTAGDLTVGYR
jgi:hypothetical protein